MNLRSPPGEPQGRGGRGIVGIRTKGIPWNPGNRLTLVLRKERTGGEERRAGRKPGALFQPCLLLSAQGLRSHDRLSLRKNKVQMLRCHGYGTEQPSTGWVCLVS